MLPDPRQNRPERGVLFDLDGTLADTAPDLGGALNRMLGTRGREPLPIATIRPYVSAGARGLLGLGFGLKPGDQGYDPLREEFLHEYGTALCVDSKLFDGITHVLDQLEANAVPWGIVTNKPARYTDPLVALLGLHPRAGCVVSGDTCARAKPAPDSLLHAAELMGLPPKTFIYIGDDRRDIEAARAAGMGAVAAGYGYLGPDSDPHTWEADHVVPQPSHVLHLLGIG